MGDAMMVMIEWALATSAEDILDAAEAQAREQPRLIGGALLLSQMDAAVNEILDEADELTEESEELTEGHEELLLNTVLIEGLVTMAENIRQKQAEIRSLKPGA